MSIESTRGLFMSGMDIVIGVATAMVIFGWFGDAYEGGWSVVVVCKFLFRRNGG